MPCSLKRMVLFRRCNLVSCGSVDGPPSTLTATQSANHCKTSAYGAFQTSLSTRVRHRHKAVYRGRILPPAHKA